MTPTECVNLVKLINARCPSMRLDDATPDAWYIDLRDVDSTDAREAVIAISRRQQYVALHEVLTEAATIERRRVGQQRAAELQAQIERENAGELHQRPVAALVAGQPIPADDPVRAERRQMLAKAAHTKQERVETETREAAEHQARREQARREIAERHGATTGDA